MEEMKESPEEDWVSTICAVMGVEGNLGVMSGMFDGMVSFHQRPTKKLSKLHFRPHQDPIKAIKCMPSQQENVYYAITGSLAEDLKVSSFST